jgi:hypothetical protein
VLIPGLVSPIEYLGVFIDEINKGLKVTKGGWLETSGMPTGKEGNQDRNDSQTNGEPYYLVLHVISAFIFNGNGIRRQTCIGNMAVTFWLMTRELPIIQCNTGLNVKNRMLFQDQKLYN